MSKPKMYSVYESDNDLYVVVNNDDIHNIELLPVDSEGCWIACFDPECASYCGNDLTLKST